MSITLPSSPSLFGDDEFTLVAPSGGPTPHTPQGRPRLLKRHTGTVRYPDGATGKFTYDRQGPTTHVFTFTYADGAYLDRVCFLHHLGNAPSEIEAGAQENAATAFEWAIERERKDYFARITEPTSGSRKKDLSRAQMSAQEAKERGGKYALCRRIGEQLVPVSALFDKIGAANAEWLRNRKEGGGEALVVGCCNRMDRRWEQTKYNPLHGEGHPRRPIPETEDGRK